MTALQHLRERCRSLLADEGGRAAAAAWSDGIADLVVGAWNDTPGVCVIALGSLARRELTPGGDVDLLVLLPDAEDSAEAAEALEPFIRDLWDLGLKLGHAVRTPTNLEEAVREDQHVATSLLEARPLVGDLEHGLSTLRRMHPEALAPRRRELIESKVSELLARRKRFGESVHLVEPNAKNSPGALRDIHTVRWVGLFIAPWRPEDIGGGRGAIAHLLSTGQLTGREAFILEETLDALLAVRFGLHLAAGRAEDRLLFEHQATIAGLLSLEERPGLTPPEQLMQLYFRAARRVRNTTDRILERWLEQFAGARALWTASTHREPHARSTVRDLEYGMRERGGRLIVPDKELFSREPHRIVDAYRLAAEHDLTLSPQTVNRIERALDELGPERLTEDSRAGQAILRLCRSSEVRGAPFTALVESGVARTLMRDLARLEGRFKQDGYHAYTTDAHICRCADLALQAASGELPIPEPLQQSARRCNRFDLVVLGALFHDIGKGLEGQHAETGAEIARVEGIRMGLRPDDIDTLVFLVREHLVLSQASQRRDLSDPVVIEELATTVKTVERLDLLALLTWVDIAAVAPGMFNDWKGQLLGMATERVVEYLNDPEQGAGVRSTVEADAQREAAAALEGMASPPVVESFVSGASSRALSGRFEDELREDLVAYASYLEGGGKTVVTARPTGGLKAHVVRVVSADRAGLLADLAGALAEAGANILHAHSDVRDDHVALHAFRIDDGRGQPLDDDALRHTELTLARAVATGEVGHRRRPGRRLRGGPRVPPEVRIIRGRDSWGATIIDVRAHDRPGLMADLTRVISSLGWQTVLAKIATEGERARDSFYVMREDAAEGEGSDESVQALARGLLAVLDPETDRGPDWSRDGPALG